MMGNERKQPGDDIPGAVKMSVSEYIRGMEGIMLDRYKRLVYNELSLRKRSSPFQATVEEFLKDNDVRENILSNGLISKEHLRLLLHQTLLNAVSND